MKKKFTPTKHIILITGSSSGIGRGIVETLDLTKYIPVITYNTHQQEAQDLAGFVVGQGGNCLCLPLDLTRKESVDQCAAKIRDTFGRLDTLICNAGKDYFHQTPEDITVDEWLEVFYPKVFGTFMIVEACKDLLAASKNANIIGMTASLYEKPDPADPAYSSACAAHVNYILSLVYGLSKERIRANLINPGPIETNLHYWQELKKNSPAIFEDMAKTSPTGRLATYEEITQTIDYIISCQNLNGAIMHLNAGAHLR